MKFDALAAALQSHGVRPAIAERLAVFGALLLEANASVNLTGAKDEAALLEHLLDSLILLNDISESLVDIGSGGGLPAIPLAVATGTRVLLIESVAKKAAFLERALRELDLEGEVIADRAETAARDVRYRGTFACATARAVGSPSTVAELTVPFLRIGGRALLQRGAIESAERDALTDAALVLGAGMVEERRIGGSKTILVLEKTEPTSERFPRRNGIPAKRPLCA